MKSTMKHVTTVVLSLVVLGSVFAIAQAVNVPISMAPNDKNNTVSVTSSVVAGPLSIGRTTTKLLREAIAGINNGVAVIPGNTGLEITGPLYVEHDYSSHPRTYNCGTTPGTGGAPSNKCYSNFKFTGSTDPARTNYPTIVSTGSANFAGQSGSGVIVGGKDFNKDSSAGPALTATLTSGVKLEILNTIVSSATLQGDPGASYMNHAGGFTFPGASCTDPTNPACKKVACIDTTGNIITCPDAGTATNYTPQRPACSDGKDNDDDGMTDGADLGCWCSNSYSQTGARACGVANESSPNNPTCPAPC